MKLSKLKLKLLFTALILMGCADKPEDFPYSQQIQCEEQGGVCTPDIICPPGQQPLYADDPKHTNCLSRCCVETVGGYACNPASQDTEVVSSYNCVPDEEGVPCPGEWSKVGGNLTCEDGRSCCYWSGK